jgi:hypothetical protein
VNKKKQKNFDPLSFGYSGLVSFIPASFAAKVTDQETSSVQSFLLLFVHKKKNPSPSGPRRQKPQTL